MAATTSPFHAVEQIGTLGVDIACNDVAASGAIPAWLTVVVFLPDAEPDALDAITAQLDAASSRLDVAIVGGHSEYAPAHDHPMLVLTCLGLTERYVPTDGADAGDVVLMTKAAGIEATAILGTDFRDRLSGVSDEVVARAIAYHDDVSVVTEAVALAELATGMHDPTEGGMVNGLVELAVASGVSLEVDRRTIPVREETRLLCDAVGIDPLTTFGSGSLLVTIPEKHLGDARARLDVAGVGHAVIGSVGAVGEPSVAIDGETISEPIRDAMYALWE